MMQSTSLPITLPITLPIALTITLPICLPITLPITVPIAVYYCSYTDSTGDSQSSPIATISSNTCSKCVTGMVSGRRSCCVQGGAWFGQCGDAGDADVEHTWEEGIKACEGRFLNSKSTSLRQSL